MEQAGRERSGRPGRARAPGPPGRRACGFASWPLAAAPFAVLSVRDFMVCNKGTFQTPHQPGEGGLSSLSLAGSLSKAQFLQRLRPTSSMDGDGGGAE